MSSPRRLSENPPFSSASFASSLSAVRNRERQARSAAMQETDIREAVIVTEEQEETVETPHGTIRCIPARRFFTDALQEMYER